MLSFKQFFLNENRVDFIKKINPIIDSSHDRLAEHRGSSDIIDHFAEKADPSAKKVYTSWIINQYKNKHVRQEDAPRIHTTLSNFRKYAPKLPSKDLNSYKHISDLEDALEPHAGTISSNKEQKRLVKSEGADLIHDGPDLMVHRLKTKEAACQYGAGTKWCTAAKNDNMFDVYHKQGPLYVVQNKKTGDKHQFHFETQQFMDEKDREIDLPKFVEKNPELKNIDEFRNSKAGFHFARNQKEFDVSMNKALNDEHRGIRKAAIRHPNATSEHISKALDDEHWAVRETAIQHPKATLEHISKALDDEDHHVRYAAIAHHNVTPEHISKALNDEDWHVRKAAIRRKHGIELASRGGPWFVNIGGEIV